ncbi:MAG: carbohydrate binding family 9 domain-containing protein [Chitinophagaceae bacterium]|nr:carbohydrate binding family 9 domain-containing protein [Chitinophagaceae bacterium]
MKTNLMKMLLLLCFALQARAQEYVIRSTNKPLKLDGVVSEEAWKDANLADNFTQWVPHPDQPSLYKTEVRILYTKSGIYLGAKLYQPKQEQLRQITARDELTRCNADVFSLHLDPYNDKQNGFVFRVSSVGVQQDERISGGTEFGDITWDAVWDAKTSAYEDHWELEIEIPFSAIRFSSSANPIWGMNFTRLVRKKNETSYWSPISLTKNGFLSQEGKLLGFENINPPVRLFLYPYLTLGYYEKPSNGRTETGFSKSGGLDFKYGVNESFTLDATLIPDFSQVISDNLIRNLSAFEQQLNENRPFFTEGTELFNKADLFYSRRVGARPDKFYEVDALYGDTSKYEIRRNPNVTTLLNAIKFSGRTKKNLGIGIFNAITSPMHALVYDKIENKSIRYETSPLSNYNVLVLDKPFKGQSFLNFTNTSMLRQGESHDANVSSLQWVQFDKKEKHSIMLVGKWSNQFRDTIQSGTYVLGEFRKTAGKFRFGVSGSILSPNYNQTDMGIQFNLNEVLQNVSFTYGENKPKLPFLQTYRITFENFFRENFIPYQFKEYQSKLTYFWLFKSFWDVTLELESKPFAPVDFYLLRSYYKKLITNPYFWTGLGGSSDSRKKLFWAFYCGYGFSNNNKTGYFYSEQSIRYLIQNKFEITLKGSMTRDDANIGFAYYDESIQEPIVGKRFVREYEGNLTVKYNFSPTLNINTRFRHYNTFITYQGLFRVGDEGDWRNRFYSSSSAFNENFNLQNVDVFLNWIFRPGSRLVFSYKQWLQNAYILNNRPNNQYYNNVYEVIQSPKAYEVALRLIYFLDYNRLKLGKL